MSEPVSLVPSPTPWERALSLTSAERHPGPINLIRDVWDPWQCPEHLFPYLAAALSVDIWRSEWGPQVKRWVIDNAIRHHRQKGTLAGLKAYVDLVNSSVIRVVTPPARLIAGRSITAEEEDVLLAKMPELRVYPFARQFVTGHPSFFNRNFMTPERLFAKAHRGAQTRAEMRQNGVITTLGMAQMGPSALNPELQPFEQLYFPYAWKGAYILGNVRHQRFIGTSTAARFAASFRSSPIRIGARSVVPGLEPGEARPDLIAEVHQGPPQKMFCGRVMRGKFMIQSTAPGHIYHRLRLWDPAAVGALRPSRSYFGTSQFGMPPHTAAVSLRVPIKPARRKLFFGEHLGRVIPPHDGKPLADALEAIRASQAAHDRIMVNLDHAFEQRFYAEN